MAEQPTQRAAQKTDPFLTFVAIAIAFVAGAMVLPPLAFFFVLGAILIKLPRRFSEFCAMLRFNWRRNIHRALSKALLIIGSSFLLIAVFLYPLGTRPEIHAFFIGFSPLELLWVCSAVFFALAGLVWGGLLHVLARKPKKVGIEL